jgi:hypothetical protein
MVFGPLLKQNGGIEVSTTIWHFFVRLMKPPLTRAATGLTLSVTIFCHTFASNTQLKAAMDKHNMWLHFAW